MMGKTVVDGRLALTTNPENISRGCPRRYAYASFFP